MGWLYQFKRRSLSRTLQHFLPPAKWRNGWLDQIQSSTHNTATKTNKHTMQTPIAKLVFYLLMCRYHYWTTCKFSSNVMYSMTGTFMVAVETTTTITHSTAKKARTTQMATITTTDNTAKTTTYTVTSILTLWKTKLHHP